jgi:hypothetical protein
MIILPYVSLPDGFTRLLASNIQNTTLTNNNLEQYIIENKELNVLVKKLFQDIDPDGFLGKIISISGWSGIRNRLASAYLEHLLNGYFPDTCNNNLVTDIINLENKLRHFTPVGYSRAFLLGFYAKMSMINLNKIDDSHKFSPLIIRDDHLDLMKYSKSKSIKIDWLILQLILFENILGIELVKNLLQNGIKFNALFNMLKESEKKWFINNVLTYGASVADYEFFLSDNSLVG